MVFTENRHHPWWQVDSSIAPLVATASGPYGTNADYVFRLADAPGRLGLRDAHVGALESALRRHPRHASPADAS